MQMTLMETELVSPTSFCRQSYQWNGNIVSFDVMSKWRASVIVKLRLSSGHQKLARKAGTDWPDPVHIIIMSYMRRSCDHNSRRRVLTISNWSRSYRGLPFAASLICIACLFVEIIQSWFFSSAEPLWPCIKVKVIETTMSKYPMNKSIFMPSLNVIA